MMRIICTFAALVICCGCSSWGSGSINPKVNRRLSDIHLILRSTLPLGNPRMRDKGREYISRPFRIQDRKFVSAETLSDRYYAQVLVRGIQPPYSIEFYVYREQKDSNGKFRTVESDSRLAEVMRARFNQQLVKSRDDLNLIDDFRAF